MTKSTTERDDAQALRDWQASRTRALSDSQELSRYLASFDKLPQQMRDAPRWVMWRYEPHKDNPTTGKPRKVPLSCSFNGRASSVNPDSWSDLDVVRARLKADHAPQRSAEPRYAEGIGFMLGDGWIGIDLDKVRDPRKEGKRNTEDWALHLGTLAKQAGAYIDISPNGTGYHFILRGTMPSDWSNNSPKWDKVGAVEIYDSGRYFTMSPHTASMPHEVGALDRTSELWLELDQYVGHKRTATKAKSLPDTVLEPKTTTVLQGQPRAVAKLSKSVAEIVNAPEGQSNPILNTEAFKVGQLVATGKLNEQYARERLIAAGLVRKPADTSEVHDVVSRAMTAGMEASVEIQPTSSMPSEIALAHEARRRLNERACNVGHERSARWALFVSHAGNEQGVWRIDDDDEITAGAAHVRMIAESVVADLVPPSGQRIRVIDSIIRHLAATMRRSPKDFDSTPTTIGLGTIDDPLVCDLTTGEVRPMTQEDMCSKLTGVAPTPRAEVDPLIWTFIDGILTPQGQTMSDEVRTRRDYVLDWFAYSLLGVSLLQVLVLQGTTRNGKGLLMQLALKAFGDYADVIDGCALWEKQSHPTSIMDLRGKRLVMHDEVDTSQPLNAARIKMLTGGAPQKGRHMGNDYGKSFAATTSIALTTNTTLRFVNSDQATEKRFPRVILPNEYKEDHAFKARVLTLGGSLLRILIDRAPALCARGPQVPMSMTDDARQYAVADTHIAWLSDNLTLDPSGFVEYAALLDRRCAELVEDLGYDIQESSNLIDRRRVKEQLIRDLPKTFAPNSIQLNKRPASDGIRHKRGVGGVRWSGGDSVRDLPI